MSRLRFLLFTLVFIIFGLFLFHSNVFAQTAPGTPGSVLITYPARQGVNLDATQATCTWGAATDAASYSVQITEVDSNTIVTTQTLSSSTLTYTFPVTSGKTYKCSVTAINSAGTAGVAGTFSLLCETDVVTNPTAAPTSPPAQPPPPVAGNMSPLIISSMIGFVILIFGAMIFAL